MTAPDGAPVPKLPLDDLRSAADSPEAQAHVDALAGELDSEAPSTERIAASVEGLRAWPRLAAIVTGWWEDPRTQLFIDELSNTGL